MKKTIYISVFLSSVLFSQENVEQLKKQLEIQEKMITELTKRLDKLENTKITNTDVQNEKTVTQEHVKVQSNSSNSSFSQSAFMPDIALIINSSAVGRNVDNLKYADYEMPGFVDAGTAVIPFNPNRGFNLNYAEVAMSAAVDPYFDAFAIFHMEADAFEIEEAYVSTRGLENGFKVKAGKFKSAIGRLNEKHQHAWDFSEQPLVYSALFGPEGVNDPGVQLQWVAPIDTYLMFGLESMQGTNEQSFGYEKSNNLYNAYVKSSIDFSDSTSMLLGASLLNGKSIQGATDIFGADLTLQMQFSSYSSLTWQSEYFNRNMSLDTGAKKQGGIYSQLVYKYDNNYAAGIRYDSLMKNSAGDENLDMYTAMIEYKPFEFSRLRLEYSLDKSKYFSGQQEDVQQIMLELNVAVGAHSAHSY